MSASAWTAFGQCSERTALCALCTADLLLHSGPPLVCACCVCACVPGWCVPGACVHRSKACTHLLSSPARGRRGLLLKGAWLGPASAAALGTIGSQLTSLRVTRCSVLPSFFSDLWVHLPELQCLWILWSEDCELDTMEYWAAALAEFCSRAPHPLVVHLNEWHAFTYTSNGGVYSRKIIVSSLKERARKREGWRQPVTVVVHDRHSDAITGDVVFPERGGWENGYVVPVLGRGGGGVVGWVKGWLEQALRLVWGALVHLVQDLDGWSG